MKSYETKVKSFFRGRDTRFFEEDASKISHPAQLKRFRESFANSNGQRGTIDIEDIGSARIDYEGQLTIVSSRDDNTIFLNHCSGPDVSIVNYSSALRDFRSGLSMKNTVENGAFCLSIGGYNFHHFLFEILPSLYIFREELQEIEHLILGAANGSSFIKEFNEILRIHKSLQLLPLRSSIEVNHAFAITPFPFRIYPVEILEEIRIRMKKESLKFSNAKAAEICFIGRGDRDRNRRNLLNEEAVLKELESCFGSVNLVRPGTTKLIETVSQIRDSRVIIGMLGGSLAHLIWAHSLELFIEIVPLNYFGATETEELSRIFGFEYRKINSFNVNSENWAWADQNCDIIELQFALKNLKIMNL